MFNTPSDFAVWYGLLGMCIFACVSKAIALCRAKICFDPLELDNRTLRAELQKLSCMNREANESHQRLAHKLMGDNHQLWDKWKEVPKRFDEYDKAIMGLEARIDGILLNKKDILRRKCRPFMLKILDAVAARPKEDWKVINGGILVDFGHWHFFYLNNYSQPTLPAISVRMGKLNNYKLGHASFTDVERFLFFVYFSEMWDIVMTKTNREPSQEILDFADSLGDCINVTKPSPTDAASLQRSEE